MPRSSPNAEVIRELSAAGRLLVALDFDGVLAPLAGTPDGARILPRSDTAVRELCRLPGTTVAVISGRGLADLRSVSGLGPPVRLIGSHGAESDDAPDLPMTEQQRLLRERVRDEVTRLAADVPGALAETKPAGAAVHVRNAAPEAGARLLAAVRAGPGSRPGVRGTEGKAVVDLAVVEMDKGAALRALCAARYPDRVLFAGDDVTDERAFGVLGPGDVGVKVGAGDSAAGYRVPGPAELAELLAELAAARAAAPAGAREAPSDQGFSCGTQPADN